MTQRGMKPPKSFLSSLRYTVMAVLFDQAPLKERDRGGGRETLRIVPVFFGLHHPSSDDLGNSERLLQRGSEGKVNHGKLFPFGLCDST